MNVSQTLFFVRLSKKIGFANEFFSCRERAPACNFRSLAVFSSNKKINKKFNFTSCFVISCDVTFNDSSHIWASLMTSLPFSTNRNSSKSNMADFLNLSTNREKVGLSRHTLLLSRLTISNKTVCWVLLLSCRFNRVDYSSFPMNKKLAGKNMQLFTDKFKLKMQVLLESFSHPVSYNCIAIATEVMIIL